MTLSEDGEKFFASKQNIEANKFERIVAAIGSRGIKFIEKKTDMTYKITNTVLGEGGQAIILKGKGTSISNTHHSGLMTSLYIKQGQLRRQRNQRRMTWPLNWNPIVFLKLASRKRSETFQYF